MRNSSTTMTRATVVTVVLLMVLAGCAGLVPGAENGGSAEEPDTRDDGLTSNGTTNDTGSNYLAPGLTAEGVLNVPLLLEHHFAILENESQNGAYIVVEEANETANETLQRTVESRYVVQPGERWYQTQTTVTYNDTTTETTIKERWTENGTEFNRIDPQSGSPTYGTQELETIAPPDHPRRARSQLEVSLDGIRTHENVTVDDRVQNETTVYVVNRTWENGSITFHIREDGFIMQYTLREQRPDRMGFYQEQNSFNFTDEILERPDWYDQARNATAESERTADE